MEILEWERNAESEQKIKREGTHTRTCVDHCWFDWMRTELRPGPLALRTVVSSARMMNVFPLANVRFFDCAVDWET